MGRHRMNRVNQLILEEIAKCIQEDLKDPDLGFITVVRVHTTQNLSLSTVSVSVLGDDEERVRSLAALNRAAGYIRSVMKPHLKMKMVPKLLFEEDETAREAQRISALLKGTIVPEGNEE